MSTLSESGKQALDEFIQKTLAEKRTPGFTLGVSNVDSEIYFSGGGPSVVNDPTSGEIGPDSVFWICSQTKMITALAVLKLIDLQILTLSTPASTYIPHLRSPIIVDRTSTQKTAYRPLSPSTPVTIKHLLNYTSGLFYPVVKGDLTGLGEGYWSKEMHACEDPVEGFLGIVIGELPGVPLKFEPGTNFVYGWSSDILGFIVEKASGQTLEEFCTQHIFNPLSLQSPSFYLTPELQKRAVDLTFRSSDGRLSAWDDQVKIIERDYAKVRLHLGGIGMYSSMRDYLSLLRHLMQIHAGKTVPNAILTPQSVATIFTPSLPPKAARSLSDFVGLVPGGGDGLSTRIEDRTRTEDRTEDRNPDPSPSLQWGTAMALTTRDWPRRRRAGSAFWSGWAGTSHFIDPQSGIAVVFGIQTAPSPDVEALGLWAQLEELVYAGLVGGGVGEGEVRNQDRNEKARL